LFLFTLLHLLLNPIVVARYYIPFFMLWIVLRPREGKKMELVLSGWILLLMFLFAA
jgi:hypothetical protein